MMRTPTRLVSEFANLFSKDNFDNLDNIDRVHTIQTVLTILITIGCYCYNEVASNGMNWDELYL